MFFLLLRKISEGSVGQGWLKLPFGVQSCRKHGFDRVLMFGFRFWAEPSCCGEGRGGGRSSVSKHNLSIWGRVLCTLPFRASFLFVARFALEIALRLAKAANTLLRLDGELFDVMVCFRRTGHYPWTKEEGAGSVTPQCETVYYNGDCCDFFDSFEVNLSQSWHCGRVWLGLLCYMFFLKLGALWQCWQSWSGAKETLPSLSSCSMVEQNMRCIICKHYTVMCNRELY